MTCKEIIAHIYNIANKTASFDASRDAYSPSLLLKLKAEVLAEAEPVLEAIKISHFENKLRNLEWVSSETLDTREDLELGEFPLAISPDGTFAVYGDRVETLSLSRDYGILWSFNLNKNDDESSEQIMRCIDGEMIAGQVQFSADGKRLHVGTYRMDGNRLVGANISTFQLDGGQQLPVNQESMYRKYYSFHVRSNGEIIFTDLTGLGVRDKQGDRKFDISSQEKTIKLFLSHKISALVDNEQADESITINEAGAIIWDTQNRKIRECRAGIVAAAYSGDGLKRALSDFVSKEIVVEKLAEPDALPLRVSGNYDFLAMDETGKFLVAAKDREVRIFRLDDDEAIQINNLKLWSPVQKIILGKLGNLLVVTKNSDGNEYYIEKFSPDKKKE